MQFLNAMSSGEKLPERLKVDANQVRLILTADIAELDEALKATTKVDGIKRSPDQLHGCKFNRCQCFDF